MAVSVVVRHIFESVAPETRDRYSLPSSARFRFFLRVLNRGLKGTAALYSASEIFSRFSMILAILAIPLRQPSETRPRWK